MKHRLSACAFSVAAAAVGWCLVTACEQRPSITVEPNSDLTDGSEVVVTLRGFEPDTWQYVAQSSDSGGRGPEATVHIGAEGSARVTLQLQQQLHTLSSDPSTGQTIEIDFDCRYRGACVVSAGGVPQSEWPALNFRDEITPVVSATPTTNLPPWATVTVSGSSLPANLPISVYQCLAGTDTCDVLDQVWTDADGRLSGSVQVPLVREQYTCDAPGKCELRVQFYNFVFARSSLSFSTTALDWSASPSTNLAVVQDVAVSGSVAAGEHVSLYQCLETSAGARSCVHVGMFTGDSLGAYAGVVSVSQRTETMICDAPGKCFLALAISGQTLLPRRIPLTFKPVGPAVAGTLQTSSVPVAAQPMPLFAAGWASNTAVRFGFVARDLAAYDLLNKSLAIASASGDFSATTTPRAFLEGRSRLYVPTDPGFRIVTLFDCTLPGNCSIQAIDFRSRWESTIPTAVLPTVVQPATTAVGTARIRNPIVYAPQGPLPVTLEGGGWPANQALTAYECTSQRTVCFNIAGAVNTDASGAFEASTYLLPFSCGAVSNGCEILVTYSDGRAGLSSSPSIPLVYASQP